MVVYKCPVCGGQGEVNKPPWVAGDQETWVSTSSGPYLCQACNGQGIIWGRDESDESNST